MSKDIWSERERALEESFFMKRNQELLEKLRLDVQAEQNKEALSAACGIRDDKMLNHLLAAGIGPQTVAALALVPMVVVAWADGDVKPKERDAVLEAATSEGIEPGSVSYQLLHRWLEEPPQDSLLVAWKDYVQAISQQFTPEALQAFREEVLGRALKVAKAAGGILGIHAVSQAEQQVLDDLKSAFPK